MIFMELDSEVVVAKKSRLYLLFKGFLIARCDADLFPCNNSLTLFFLSYVEVGDVKDSPLFCPSFQMDQDFC